MDKNIKREIKTLENENKLEIKKTDLKKMSFISEIKNGLGEEIKGNPNSVIVTIKPKKTLIKKFLDRLTNIF